MPGIEKIKNIFFIKFLIKYFNQILNFRKKIGEKQSLFHKIFVSEIYLVLLSFFSVLAVEMINNGNFNVLLSLSVNNVRFIFAFILFFAINQFLFLSTFRLSIPLFFTFPISVIISFINYSKLFYRGEPFVINDLYLAKELFKIMNKYNFVVIKEVYFAIIIFIILLTSLFFIGRIKLKKRVRFLFFAPSLFIFLFFLNFFVISDVSFLNKVYQKDLFNAEAEYKSNGFLIFFLGRAKLAQIKAPDSYSQSNVKKYAAELNYSEDIDYSKIDDASKPNVIVIMNEAFWNPDYMTGVKLNIDPLEKIRRDKDITIGSLISPVMGGATSQVEYEFLTGKSTYFFPAGSIVYTQYILNKQWSLGWYFKAMDYNSVFIHPWEKDFYNRDNVISLLGFDEKYFMHNMRNTETRRGIISDLSVAKEIITCYEENNGKPFFSFAITMQNHGGWPVCNYYPKSVEVGLEYGDTSLKTSLEEYLEGVKDGCEAYKYLVDYFKKVDKPTYIVMFGDHSPSIALDARMFKDNKISDDDRKNIYTTPIFIWSNVKKDIEVDNFTNVSPPMLTTELFNLAKLPKPGYIKALNELKKTISAFTLHYAFNKETKLDKNSSDIANSLEKIKNLQYDTLLGSKYAINEFKNIKLIEKNFNIDGKWVLKKNKQQIAFYIDANGESFKFNEEGKDEIRGNFSFGENNFLNFEGFGKYKFKLNKNKLTLQDSKEGKKIKLTKEEPNLSGIWFCDKGLLIIYKKSQYYFHSYGDGLTYNGIYSQNGNSIALIGDLKTKGIYKDESKILNFGEGYDYKRISSQKIDKKKILGDWTAYDSLGNPMLITFSGNGTFTFNNQTKKYFVKDNLIVLQDFNDVFVREGEYLIYKTQSWDYVYKKSINGEWVESSAKKDGRILFDYQTSSYKLLKSNFENKTGTYKFDAVGNLTLDEVENYSFKRINESKVLLIDADGKKKLYEKVIKSEEKPYICGTWFCDKGLLIIYKNQKYFFKSYGSGVKYSGDYSLISDTILLKGDLMVMGSYNKNILSFGVGYDYKRIFDKSIYGEWNSLDKFKSEKIFFDVENEEYKIYDQKNAIASGKIYFEENNVVNLEGSGRFNLSVNESSLKAFEISSRKTYSYKRENVEYGGIWRGDMGLLIITPPDNYYYHSYGSDNASRGNYYVEDNRIILLGDTSEIGTYREGFLNFGVGYDYKRVAPENISRKDIVGEWIGVNENANGLSIKFYKNGKFYYNYETKKYYVNKNYVELEGFKDIFIKSDKYLVFKTKDAEFVYEKKKIEDKEKVVKSKDKSSKKKMKKEKSSGIDGLWLCDNGILDLSDKKRYYFYNRVFGNPFKGWYEVKNGVIKLNGELVFTGNIVGEIIDFGSEFQYTRFNADKINFKKFKGVYKTKESEASFKEIEIKADNKLFIDKKEYGYFSGERFIKVFGIEGMLVASEDNIVHYSKEGEYLFSR